MLFPRQQLGTSSTFGAADALVVVIVVVIVIEEPFLIEYRNYEFDHDYDHDHEHDFQLSPTSTICVDIAKSAMLTLPPA